MSNTRHANVATPSRFAPTSKSKKNGTNEFISTMPYYNYYRYTTSNEKRSALFSSKAIGRVVSDSGERYFFEYVGKEFDLSSANDYFNDNYDVLDFNDFDELSEHVHDANAVIHGSFGERKRSDVFKKYQGTFLVLRMCLLRMGLDRIGRDCIVKWMLRVNHSFKSFRKKNVIARKHSYGSYKTYFHIPRTFDLVRNFRVIDTQNELEDVYLNVGGTLLPLTKIHNTWILCDWFSPPYPPLPIMKLLYHEVSMVTRCKEEHTDIVVLYDAVMISHEEDFISFSRSQKVQGTYPRPWQIACGMMCVQ